MVGVSEGEVRSWVCRLRFVCDVASWREEDCCLLWMRSGCCERELETTGLVVDVVEVGLRWFERLDAERKGCSALAGSSSSVRAGDGECSLSRSEF